MTQHVAVLDVVAPVTGRVFALEAVSDPAFASGALGPGLALAPADGRIVAPTTGRLVVAMPHAYGVLTEAGVEVLVHIGIDTVQLHGAHFAMKAQRDDWVKAGDPLVDVDLDAVAAAGYDTSTVVVITGRQDAREVHTVAQGSVVRGDALLTVGP